MLLIKVVVYVIKKYEQSIMRKHLSIFAFYQQKLYNKMLLRQILRGIVFITDNVTKVVICFYKINE